MTPDQFEEWLQSQCAQEEARLLTLRFRAEEIVGELRDADKFLNLFRKGPTTLKVAWDPDPNLDAWFLHSCGIAPID